MSDTHVLIVEDELTTLEVMREAIDRAPRLRASGRGSCEEAMELVETDVPDLLITDLNLPGRSGLDLINELRDRGLRIPVIVVTAFRAEYNARLAGCPGLTILEKPFTPSALIETVRARLRENQTGGAHGLTFQPIDYLQLASMGRFTMILRISTEPGDEAWLDVVDGNVWNAFFGHLTGRQAVLALIRERARAASTEPLSALPVERQIGESTSSLLMHAAHSIDETDRSP